MISEEIYSLIGSEAFIMVNKKVLRLMHGNADAAVLLIELINIYKMLSNKLAVDEFGYFKVPCNWINKTLAMSVGKQKTVIAALENLQLIDTKKKGYPASRHISLNFFNIKTLLESDETTKEDIQRAEFYSNINEFIANHTAEEIEEETKVFGKMKVPLRETIKYITVYHMRKYYNRCSMVWTSRDVGVLRDFLNKKFFAKPFDYAFVAKVLRHCANQNTISEIIDNLVKQARGTAENAPGDQVFNIKELKC